MSVLLSALANIQNQLSSVLALKGAWSSIASAIFVLIGLRAVFRWKNVLEDIDGPEPESWLYGNMLQLHFPRVLGEFEFKWQERFGPVYRFKGCFGRNGLMVCDPHVIQQILSNDDIGFGPAIDYASYAMFGPNSVQIRRGDTHKRFRSVLDRGFTATAVREYEPILQDLATDLSEKWEADATADSQPGALEVTHSLRVATLGAISRAMLGRTTQDLGETFMYYNFETVALSSTQDEKAVLVNGIASYLPQGAMRSLIYLPLAANRIIRAAYSSMDNLGKEIVKERLQYAKQGIDTSGDFYGKLIGEKENEAAPNIMTADEIVAQTSLILLAGQDTTANAMAFTLFELAKNQELQNALRTEIYDLGPKDINSERSSAVIYDGMPLLNAVIKESLRMYPAEPWADRVALRDTVVSLRESITTISGQQLNQVPLRKGDSIVLGFGAYQRQTPRWGSDPHVFRPSRWLLDEGNIVRNDGIGPYANLLTFGGGDYTCLGWRLASVFHFNLSVA
uniref:Cytochrome P450 n=1 Tax=Mycena chlorophos TaxID=658473 RepID=A0ABQ0LDK0_MYCCL|nr:cytochrome P450 [Mycena chlorophos]